jgi:ABC-type sugar transport system ATPase subunit
VRRAGRRKRRLHVAQGPGVNAVIADFDIADNMTLPFLKAFSRLSFLSERAQRRATSDMIGRRSASSARAT